MLDLPAASTDTLRASTNAYAVPPRDPNFTGRQDILDSLEDLLFRFSDERRQAAQNGSEQNLSQLGPYLNRRKLDQVTLVGPSGTEKSAIASEIAHRVLQELGLEVFWVDLTDDTNILDQFSVMLRQRNTPLLRGDYRLTDSSLIILG